MQTENDLAALKSAISSLGNESTEAGLTVGEIAARLGNNGRWLFIFLISIPFVQPIPIPGVSVAFGIVILLTSYPFLFGNIPSTLLPAFLGRRMLSKKIILRATKGAIVLLERLERLSRPGRLPTLSSVKYQFVSQFFIGLGGIALALPIPPVIPFSNSIPAWSILLSCAGIMICDGVWIICGWVLGIAAWLYFAICWQLIVAGLDLIIR